MDLKRPTVIHAADEGEDTHSLVAVVLVAEGEVVRVSKAAGPARRRRRWRAYTVVKLRRDAALVARTTNECADLSKVATRWRGACR